MVSEEGWERFKGGPVTAFRDRIYASIGPQKKILFNANLYFAWGSPTAVYLFLNRRLKQIALMPAPADDATAFPMKQHERSFFIMAGSFCRHYNIRVKRTHRFTSPTITDDGQLILDLEDTTEVSRERGGKPGRKEV